MSLRPDLRLDWCSYEAAEFAVKHWHYSRSMPMPPLVKIGVWEAGQFIGCVLFSRGASPHLAAPYRLPLVAVAELTRVALNTHRTPVSRLLSISVRLVCRANPGLRLLVSFADANEGHHGGIYQAAGWLYAGVTAEKFDYIGPDGKRYRDRQVTASGLVRQFGQVTRTFTPAQCTPVRLLAKHRYLMPLDPAMRAQLLPLARPYPKRPCATSISADASAVQAEDGGSTPTVALPVLLVAP